jgi:BirA family transcriptional regulator, biotin operon repressor / biotin---[acetyl-CoA-carboxylase] ligase
MLSRAKDGAAENDWLIADRQTAGRGRLGREWYSPAGNFYGSTLVRLRPDDPDAATLALVMAIAVFETAALSVNRAVLQIKWPNDILGCGAKLTGILLERAGDAVVIGVGLNLATHPEEPGRPTTSLVALGAVLAEPIAIAQTLSDIFVDWLSAWRWAGLDTIRTAWVERAHPVGTALTASLPDGTRLDGVFEGLTSAGALRLRLANGAVRVIHAGDVFLI